MCAIHEDGWILNSINVVLDYEISVLLVLVQYLSSFRFKIC